MAYAKILLHWAKASLRPSGSRASSLFLASKEPLSVRLDSKRCDVLRPSRSVSSFHPESWIGKSRLLRCLARLYTFTKRGTIRWASTKKYDLPPFPGPPSSYREVWMHSVRGSGQKPMSRMWPVRICKETWSIYRVRPEDCPLHVTDMPSPAP